MSSAPSLPGMPRQRRRRWDAGQIVVTARDLAVLRYAGEMYGLRDDALHALLTRLSPQPGHMKPAGLSDRTARVWLERMERAGYITRRRLLGHVWTTPTRDGLQLAGLPYERWNFGAQLADDEPGGWVLEHVHAAALVRFALELEFPTGRWVPEREFKRRRQATGALVRAPDGAIDLDGRRIGVEVELSRKKPESYRRILRDPHISLNELHWFTKPALRPWLERTLGDTPKPSRPTIVVRELPESL